VTFTDIVPSNPVKHLIPEETGAQDVSLPDERETGTLDAPLSTRTGTFDAPVSIQTGANSSPFGTQTGASNAPVSAQTGAQDAPLSGQTGANPSPFEAKTGAPPAPVSPNPLKTGAQNAPLSEPQDARVYAGDARVYARKGLPTYPTVSPSLLSKTSLLEQEERGAGENRNAQPKRAKRSIKPTSEQFARFWAAYPLRKGRPKALERFLALTPETAERAIAAAAIYAAECRAEGREDQHIKWPQGWLSEKRYDDELPDPREKLTGPNGKKWGWWRGKEQVLRDYPAQRWRDAIAASKPNGVWPWWFLTGPPGDPECLVPQELLDELKLVERYQGRIESEKH
jgi:hypothetical protein